MAELKTKPTNASVSDFVRSLPDEIQRNDSAALVALFKKVTGHPPRMWGTSIVGFDMYHYKSERSRQEGDWPLAAFAPRKGNLTLYVANFDEYGKLEKKLGKHKTSGGCLHIKKLDDVDLTVLEEIIKKSYTTAKEIYGSKMYANNTLSKAITSKK